LPGFPYTRYHEIAAVMKPEEIHPEVREKLDKIMEAFRLWQVLRCRIRSWGNDYQILICELGSL